MNPLLDDLKTFVDSMVPDDADRKLVSPCGAWWFSNPPFDYEMNRELCSPGIHAGYPDGVLAIRTDGDFWVDAKLPWRFSELSLQEVAGVLWPDTLTADNVKYELDVTPTELP